jgi:hypothetical protein
MVYFVASFSSWAMAEFYWNFILEAHLGRNKSEDKNILLEHRSVLYGMHFNTLQIMIIASRKFAGSSLDEVDFLN